MKPWTDNIRRDGRPIFLAIADAIEAAVAGGALRTGERLPTHRALAGQLKVDLTTVTRAYAEAQRRGLLEAAVGRGTFVREAASGGGAVDLSMNLPPQPASPSLAQLIPDGLGRLLAADPALLTYRTGVTPAEAEAIAAWLRPTLGVVARERVLVTAGAQPALLAVLGSLARRGQIVLADCLTYPGLRAAAAELGVGVRGVAGDAEGMLPDALEAALPAVAVYLIPTIHNPTTATLSPARRQALAAVVARHGLPIVEDDAYGLLPTAPQAALATLAPTYHIATLSKVIAPGLRVAALVAPDAAAAARLAAALRANIFMPSPLFAALAAQWARDGTAAAVLAAVRAEAAVRQRLAAEILPPGSFAAHPEGLHLWLRLPAPWGRHAFVAHLREQGLAVVPSDAFAVAEPAPEAVRVALGAAADRASLARALRALAGALSRQADAAYGDIV